MDETAAPTIPSEVALKLAERSDDVAQKLDEGDSCEAADEAAKLREEVTKAINEGQIPQEYLEELQSVANELDHELVQACQQPPPPPPTTTQEEEGDD